MADDVTIDGHIEFSVGSRRFSSRHTGFYHIYNVLACFTALTAAGVDTKDFQAVLDGYKTQTGRMEAFEFNKPLIMNLSKNPDGFNQNIAAMLADAGKKDLLISINDSTSDGTDITWLWDVDFEKLNDESIGRIAVAGLRKYDAALRFKYAGMDCEISDSPEQTLREFLNGGSGAVYALTNYTALFELHEKVKAMHEKYKEGREQGNEN